MFAGSLGLQFQIDAIADALRLAAPWAGKPTMVGRLARWQSWQLEQLVSSRYVAGHDNDAAPGWRAYFGIAVDGLGQHHDHGADTECMRIDLLRARDYLPTRLTVKPLSLAAAIALALAACRCGLVSGLWVYVHPRLRPRLAYGKSIQ